MDGHKRVISTIAFVLEEFINQIEKEFPGIHVVYDEKLSYETAIERLRAKYELNKQKSTSALPLFAFNRTVIKHNEHGIGRRMVTKEIKQVRTNDILKYKSCYGSFDLNFMYFDKNMFNLENFEICYTSENGISAIKNFTVKYPDIGSFSYQAKHEPLSDKIIESEGIFYKAATGVVTFTGNFFSLIGTGPIIKEINIKVKNFYDKILVSCQIT